MITLKRINIKLVSLQLYADKQTNLHMLFSLFSHILPYQTSAYRYFNYQKFSQQLLTQHNHSNQHNYINHHNHAIALSTIHNLSNHLLLVPSIYHTTVQIAKLLMDHDSQWKHMNKITLWSLQRLFEIWSLNTRLFKL